MPNLKEVKKAGNSADDEEDLKVGFRFLSPRWDVFLLCSHAQKVPQVIIFVVFSFVLRRYSRYVVHPSTNLYSWTPYEFCNPWDLRGCIGFIGTNGWMDFGFIGWARTGSSLSSKDAKKEMWAEKVRRGEGPLGRWATSLFHQHSCTVRWPCKGAGAMHGMWHWLRSHHHSYLSPFLPSVYGKTQDTRMQNYRHWV